MKGSKLYKKMYKKAKAKAFTTPMTATNNLKKYAKKMNNKMTTPEKIFHNIMKKHKIKSQGQYILNGKIFDFFLPDTKTLVEIQGDYWHGNLEVYESLSGYQKYIKKRDVMKKNIALGMGYNFVEFWEKDLHENKESVIEELQLLEIIKKISI